MSEDQRNPLIISIFILSCFFLLHVFVIIYICFVFFIVLECKSTLIQCSSRKKGEGGFDTFVGMLGISPLIVPVLRCYTMLLLLLN